MPNNIIQNYQNSNINSDLIVITLTDYANLTSMGGIFITTWEVHRNISESDYEKVYEETDNTNFTF